MRKRRPAFVSTALVAGALTTPLFGCTSDGATNPVMDSAYYSVNPPSSETQDSGEEEGSTGTTTGAE